MNAEELIAALGLPLASLVGQRVPKKLLLEHAPTPADKRRIAEGITEVQWVAALKPATVGVPQYRDEAREYLEIAILSVMTRAGAKGDRLAELIHRAVPYPVVLVSEQAEVLSLSLAHKRWSQGESGKTVLDGDVVSANFGAKDAEAIVHPFLVALTLTRQPRTQLFALYQGWMDAVMALLAARLTGSYGMAESPAQAAARGQALRECARLEVEITRLRAAAVKERQLPRQVELNLELKRVEQERAASLERL